MNLLLIIIIVILILAMLPTWPHSRAWGYGPSGGLIGVVLIVLLILALTGRL